MVIPKAKDPVENIPIATSPLMFLFWLMYIITKDVIIITGAETKIGDMPVAKAKERAAKPTSERPWPIKEYFFKTKITPRSEAQIETKTPTIRAFTIKG